MTLFQKIVKYCAMAFAILLIAGIFSGIFSVVGLLDAFSSEDAVLEEQKNYPVSGEITELDMEIAAAKLVVKEGEAFSVKSNLKHLAVEENGGKLIVKEKNHFGKALADASLTLVLPKNTVFEKLSIKTGAGRLSADTLSAEHLNLELGAGEVVIGTLTASASAEIEGGAGKITISQGSLKNLDLAMGVGRLELCAELLGESDLELGIGESNLTLLGTKEDYTVAIEKGIGSISFDGESLSSNGRKGSGPSFVDVEGGVGAIRLNFQAK